MQPYIRKKNVLKPVEYPQLSIFIHIIIYQDYCYHEYSNYCFKNLGVNSIIFITYIPLWISLELLSKTY